MAGRTPNRNPGPQFEEDSVIFQDRGANPTELGQVARVGTDILALDGQGLFNLRGAIDPDVHRQLDQLVHCLAENSFEEATYVGALLTNLTVWTDAGKTVKIREFILNYTGPLVTEYIAIQYDAAGVEVERLTKTITYAGARVDTITTVRTP